MSFYRTYRPQIIDEIDNASVREKLLSLLTKDKKDLPHAFLFSGPRGAGKTTAARVIAKLFNCINPSTRSGPCGICEQCTSIAKGRSLDVLELDAASNRGIDEIRALRDAIGLAPSSAVFKIYIIDEVHMLTTEAFNALLKTLEEPPAHAAFVLATTDPQKVPETIKSRCIRINFGRATMGELAHALARIVKAEKLNIDDDALALIARSCDGSFRDGVKILEQLSFHKGKITQEVVQSSLSLATDKSVSEFVSLFLAKKPKESLSFIQELNDTGSDVRNFLVMVLKELHTMLVNLVNGSDLSSFDGNLSVGDVQEAIKALSRAFTDMRTSPIASLPLELAVVEFSESQPSVVSHQSSATATVPVIPAKAGTQSSKNLDPRVKPEDDKKMLGMLTLDKLTECWRDVIEAIKPYNHSVAGVLRSTRPASVKDGIVVIEAFYKFHQEKLSETKTREALAEMLKKLFGEKVKVEVTLGTK